MPHLEPTYLRYIYDGLIKGSIHPENAAELPEGLIGMYEEAFDDKQPVHLRQQLLERFAIWALLKKEVSAQFVAEALNQPEADIQEFIATYSVWFNSPESGKYQLYHERLKVYLLQKLSEGEVIDLNSKLSDYLHKQTEVTEINESVSYCYQYLSFHSYIGAKLSNDSSILSNICLSEAFKIRQFELSGYYNWEEQLMQLGVEFFALQNNELSHELVFEKTKIQFKKKDIDLVLSLIRRGEIELVFGFFRNIHEVHLYARVELSYFYFLSFFEIFENHNWNFIQKKETAFKLLEIFKENFEWDPGYWLSSFIDVNISFRLHCYFEQYGLDFLIIAKLSFDTAFNMYDFASNSEIKFICANHREEGKIILKKSNQYDYGLSIKDFEYLLKSDQLEVSVENKLGALYGEKKSFSKTKLLRDELPSISYDSASFLEIYSSIIYSLNKGDLPWDLQIKILNCFKKTINSFSKNSFSISGNLENIDGKNTLKFIKNNIDQLNKDHKTLPELISDGLVIEEFMSMEPNKRFKLLNDENLDFEEDIELMLFFIELSENYQKEKPRDLLDLLSALLVEFHLNMNEKFIKEYVSLLIEFIETQSEVSSEEFEAKLFLQIVYFLRKQEINGFIRKTTIRIKDLLLDKYFNFNLYKDSFITGCELINLFSKFKIDFPEDEIVERILEDLNYLIESNDYNDLQEIDTSHIDNIHNKKYFTQFYSTIKKVPIEEFRLNLSKYVFDSIIDVKGLNHKTISYLKENSYEYPGMYLWAQKRLSLKLLEQNEFLSYVTIKDNNDLLLERLLLNIVSKRENLKNEFNIHILKYYGLDWVINLDNEYKKLIT
jgi:hypothetical protein